MSSSRLRDQAPTIFDVFCEIVTTPSNDRPFIAWKYPEDFIDERTLKSIVEFAYPTSIADSEAVQSFTFVLTDLEGRYSFGYCRHAGAKRSCFCVLSALPWTDIFYRLLNHVAGSCKTTPGRLSKEADSLLVRAYHTDMPTPGERVVLDGGLGSGQQGNKLEFVCPDDNLLPRIPDNRNLTDYYNFVREENMLAVFACLLSERRVIFTSSKLGALSACALAASGLLYPMYWQHIFIPVLPDHLVHYLHAPMPFLIGVPSSTFGKIQREHIDLSEVVVLNIDKHELITPFNDLDELPSEIVQILKKNLRATNQFGDGVARSFLRALVVLLGGYKEALKMRQGELITFSEEAFVQSRPPPMRRSLERMLHLQIFRQFIEERLAKWNAGEELRDEFEDECNLYSSKDYNRWKMQYESWMGNMRKEGNALIGRLKMKGRSTFDDIKLRLENIKDSPSPPLGASASASVGGGRKLPSPQPLLRRISSGVTRGGGHSPNRRAKSAVVRERGERDPLKNNDDDDSASGGGNLLETAGASAAAPPGASFFGVGEMDLLKELQYLMQRPNSFIEKLEQQQRLRASASSSSNDEQLGGDGPSTAGGGTVVQSKPSVSINGVVSSSIRPPAPTGPSQEALLIDFGPEKVDVKNLEIADFDPLASKSASVPSSPKKQPSAIHKGKESTTMTDLKTASSSSSSVLGSNQGPSWETFE